ncbi:hypothetical protein AQUCO_01800107v1 [Aquilegia coerulea]|uniref:Oxysterol-binding protein n=1 Tax=Aquilegia coerulea TaxID=218851 RepID=A0A2G5DK26_AQUCA|nr:hypothetical protein AQUCO_01800107v1 [Aquilegia coerulea]
MLSKCIDGKSPLERFAAVVGWSISTNRPAIFGVAPFNPILGETHHVSRGSLNVMLEQVIQLSSIKQLHCDIENVENSVLILKINHKCYNGTLASIFLSHICIGTSVEAVVYGKRKLKLSRYNENYVMNAPKLLIRFFPVPSADWVGNVTIRCKETGLEAELCYKGPSLLGFRGNNKSIKGKIFESSTSKTLFEISGHWDRTVLIKDVTDGKTTIIHDAKKTITKLNAPLVKDPKGLCSNESAVVWGEVSEAILRKDWEKARGAKNAVEEKERKLRREREGKGETWIPNHFTLFYTKEEGWDCTPKQTLVPPAPIVAPF